MRASCGAVASGSGGSGGGGASGRMSTVDGGGGSSGRMSGASIGRRSSIGGGVQMIESSSHLRIPLGGTSTPSLNPRTH
eukprot:1091191-Prymnesium_polylepis.1